MNNKLLFPLLSFCLVSLSLSAQHVVGDTMYGGRLDPSYYAPWWVIDDWMALSIPDTIYTNDWDGGQTGTQRGLHRCGMFRRHYTDNPIQITGIAGAAYSLPLGGIVRWIVLNEHIDSTYYPEYFMLMAPDGDTLRALGELHWDPSDPCRYLQIPMLVDAGEHCDTRNTDTCTFEIREYYFDKPITVSDTFYVGGTGRSGMNNSSSSSSPSSRSCPPPRRAGTPAPGPQGCASTT